MNILILSWRGPGHPHAGGAETSTHEHAKGWIRSGHNVTLFTSYFVGAKKDEILDGINIKRYGFQIFGVQWEAFKWYLFSKHPKYDLVIDQFHGIPFFTPIFVRAKKLAFIHEVTKEVWSLNPWAWPLNLLPTTIGTIFEPFIFKLFYSKIPFMTVSDSTKEDLIKWGISEKNITVIHNGASTLVYKNRLKEKKKTVIFLGALSKDKGIEDAIKTFSIIEHGSSDYQFWVVGKGERHYLQSLKVLCKELSIEKKVKFWGYVADNKKFELLSRAHLLINPSIREGWSLVVIEAASVSTPTVGYNVAGLRDSIVDGKTGILTNSTPPNLAKEIIDLMNERRLYSQIKKNCLNWSKKFTWKNATEKSLKLIQGIVAETNTS